jgi:hypothetical protein
MPIRPRIDSGYIFAGSPANTATWLHLPSAKWISATLVTNLGIFGQDKPQITRIQGRRATDYTDFKRRKSHRSKRGKAADYSDFSDRRGGKPQITRIGADPEEHLGFREVNGATPRIVRLSHAFQLWFPSV